MNAKTQLQVISETTSPLVKRLQDCLKNKNLSLHELSKTLEIPYATLYRLFNEDTQDPKASLLKQLADYFNVSIDSLLSEVDGVVPAPHCVPIIDWDLASTLSSVKKLDLNHHMNWQTLSKESAGYLSKECFALLSQPSMAPRFPVGTVFIIDKLETPRDGDFVLVKVKNVEGVTFRELSVDPPHWLLSPVVQNSPVLHFSKTEHKILGVAAMILYHARR